MGQESILRLMPFRQLPPLAWDAYAIQMRPFPGEWLGQCHDCRAESIPPNSVWAQSGGCRKFETISLIHEVYLTLGSTRDHNIEAAIPQCSPATVAPPRESRRSCHRCKGPLWASQLIVHQFVSRAAVVVNKLSAPSRVRIAIVPVHHLNARILTEESARL